MIRWKEPSLAALIVTLFVVLGGCAPRAQNGSEGERSASRSSAESVLRSLVRHYETQNGAGFMDHVHTGYRSGTMSRGGLRYQVSRVHDQYGRIDVNLYGVRVGERESSTVIRADWELDWTCRSPGPGCIGSRESVRRRGRTTFVFEKLSGEDARGWKLVSDRDSRLFGNLQPGRLVR